MSECSRSYFIFSPTSSHFIPCFCCTNVMLVALWLCSISTPPFLHPFVGFSARSLAVVKAHRAQFGFTYQSCTICFKGAVPVHSNWWFSPFFLMSCYSISLMNILGYSSSTVLAARKTFSLLPAISWWIMGKKHPLIKQTSYWSCLAYPYVISRQTCSEVVSWSLSMFMRHVLYNFF